MLEKIIFRFFSISTLIFWLAISGFCQSDSSSTSSSTAYPPVDPNLLVESKWLYTYTAHSLTNYVLHAADDAYEFYLYLNYDNKYDLYLNGMMTTGSWLLNESRTELYLNWREVEWWKIVELTNNTMVLEFEISGKVPYIYHFVRAPFESAPFPKASNELPDVEVNADLSTEELIAEARSDLSAKEKRLERNKDRKKARKAKKDAKIEGLATKETNIEIAITGGGYYGGIDPVIKDFTVIKTDGRLIKEFQSVNRGLIKTKREIGRDEVERLAQFIMDKDFFDYENLYDCQTGDCNKRKTVKPTPIPLRISVTHGNRRKVVTISIWGLDDKKIQYVNYPGDLDLIIEGIQKLASGI